VTSSAALGAFRPVPLETLDGDVAFRVRTDRKYVVDQPTLERFLDRLWGTHSVLEIAGRRTFAYDSVYFDTLGLHAARAHVQRRRRRFKARSRLYADAGACWFEIKVKGARGETVKHRLPYDTADHGVLTPVARAFLAEHLEQVPDLEPVLRTAYRRSTFAGPDERVTVDVDLAFRGARLRPEWAIVETKSPRGAGIADAALRALGARPVALSKYLIGSGLTLMENPPNDIRRTLRRYFERA
jgi:hypothetical protein